MTQVFKGDSTELKMISVASPIFDQTDQSLDEFYVGGYDSADFLLMLYDDNRMPFSQRVPRDSFVDFIREALKRFRFTGNFESYIFVLKSIFGPSTEVFFTVPAPGKIEIEINATSDVEFEFIGREFVDGAYETFNMVDYDGSFLTFRGIPGIDSQYELDLLFSELIPCGIYPTLLLSFITRFDFIAEEGSDIYDIIDHEGNTIIFYEIGA